CRSAHRRCISSSSGSSAWSGGRSGRRPPANPSTRYHSSSLPLPFAELETLARPLLPVLLALLDTRVARQEAFLLEPRPQLEVVLNQRARDAEAQRASLASNADARNRSEHVELIGRFGNEQRLFDPGTERF